MQKKRHSAYRLSCRISINFYGNFEDYASTPSCVNKRSILTIAFNLFSLLFLIYIYICINFVFLYVYDSLYTITIRRIINRRDIAC